ncbi:hypothetical protein HF521_008976 [Silurus meridionalis]|uniref:Hemicentin/VWA7 galactose-binding domain-containing protein n=1 Tax=Silurus meridionalis TaxID=175797 RepID=A0A8T0BSU2_SILME|nr:hypothetical protein HF521_008976 [Silurus meridionalis]
MRCYIAFLYSIDGFYNCNVIEVLLRGGSSQVTLLQAVRNTGKTESFSFIVDSTMQNLVIYITGNSLDYTLTSPAGVSQSSTELNGNLGIIQNVGNFHTVQPNVADQTGLWVLKMNSNQPYSIRVVGQSVVDFLFAFVNASQGLHTSYVELNTRPSANTVTLLLTLVGLDSGSPTEVSLVEASSSNSFTGTLEEVASGQYLVTFTSIPAGKFTVRVTDIFPPICEAVSIYSNCSGNCSFSSWYLTANITDWSGVQKVRTLKGNGNLDTTSVLNATGVNVTTAVYSASCCYQDLELVAVDTVGNVATCFKSASPSILSYGAEFCLFLPICFWLNVGVSFYRFMQL